MPAVDWSTYHAVSVFAGHHRTLAHVAYGFETYGVVVYAALVVALWFATRPGHDRRGKLAALAGTASGGLALLANQVIAAFWHRPRPYETHPGVYHLSHSHDPSFPSDHASAAFGIAFGVYFVDRRLGRLFLAIATLIGVGRIFVGAHYPSDVLAGAVVGALAAALVVFLCRPLLRRVILLLERLTDPVVGPFYRRFGRTEA